MEILDGKVSLFENYCDELICQEILVGNLTQVVCWGHQTKHPVQEERKFKRKKKNRLNISSIWLVIRIIISSYCSININSIKLILCDV